MNWDLEPRFSSIQVHNVGLGQGYNQHVILENQVGNFNDARDSMHFLQQGMALIPTDQLSSTFVESLESLWTSSLKLKTFACTYIFKRKINALKEYLKFYICFWSTFHIWSSQIRSLNQFKIHMCAWSIHKKVLF